VSNVWDPFLTETDREHVRRQPKSRIGFGTRPALLMIDNYRRSLGSERRPLLDALDEWPCNSGLMGWDAVDRAARLLEAARAHDVPVVHITQLAESESGVAPWTRTTKFWRGPAVGREDEKRLADFVDQLAPIDGEAVIRKSAPSAFQGTVLLGHLHQLRVDTLLVCGQATSGCVRATVVDAASHRYLVTVAEDAVYDGYEASHALSLFDMHRKYADVCPTEEIVEWIAGREL
jgi:maleamate amidohydrolase